MQAGDLVKYRRGLPHVRAGVGILVTNTGMDSVPTVWWSVVWSNGKTEIVSERNLTLIT